MTGGVRIKAILDGELAKVLERRADLVLLLENGTMLHIEFQSTNDRDMAYQAGIYCMLLGPQVPVPSQTSGPLHRSGEDADAGLRAATVRERDPV